MDKKISEIEDWWTKHSQDYQADHKKEYQSPDLIELSDDDFGKFTDLIDYEFGRKAYFAQKRGEEPFSRFIRKDVVDGKKVLEVGCGLGYHSDLLARRGALLTSIDLSKKSVDVTKRRLRLAGLEGNVIQANAEELPFGDKTFDVIWSWGVIHHSPSTAYAAKEMIRVLKPNGRIHIMLYNEDSLYKFANVYLRYGVLRGKFMNNSKQELKNMYTDGKEFGGAPLSQYFSRQDVEDMFKPMSLQSYSAYEQKNFATFLLPQIVKKRAEAFISDRLYTAIFRRMGFLGYYEFGYE